MAWENLRPGQRAEIKLQHGMENIPFVSKVLVVQEKAIGLAMPTSKGAMELLRPQTSIDVEIAGDDNLFRFSGPIIGRKSSPEQMLVMSRPEKGRLQALPKRNFFRMDISIPVEMRVMKDHLTPITEYKKAFTKDLSGGGCMVVLDKPLTKGTLVEIRMQLPPGSQDEASLLGEVMIHKVRHEEDRELHDLGVNFTIIAEPDRDKIIAFINTKLSEMRRKNKI